MLLAVDVGNSRVKLAWFEAGHLRATANQTAHTAPGVGLVCPTGCRLDLPAGGTAYLSSVFPPAAQAWLSYLLEQGWRVRWAGVDFPSPLPLDYDPPEALGTDRWLGALAATRRVGGPVLSVDCGTATTLNVVDAAGVFRGGAIACGLGTSRDALAKQASALPALELNLPTQALGRNTDAGLASGLILGHAALIAGLADQLRAEVGQPDCPIVATGGWSDLLARARPGLFDQVEPDLVLWGLHHAFMEEPR